jgi:hypothetical protein
MKPSFRLRTLHLLTLFLLGPPLLAPARGDCEPHGTAASWHADLDEAAREAEAEQRLLFVIHISGEFEDEGYT